MKAYLLVEEKYNEITVLRYFQEKMESIILGNKFYSMFKIYVYNLILTIMGLLVRALLKH